MAQAADRLALTRLAILQEVHERHGGMRKGAPTPAPASPQARERVQHAHAGSHSRLSVLAALGRGYWEQHPARAALELARPQLAAFAARRPATYVGSCVLAGGVLLLARPWRLISLTGVLVALLKSPQVAALLGQAMASGSRPTRAQADI